MAAITDWVRGLVILVVLASLLEMLLPMGSMKKFVQLAMGLLILLGIVRPVVNLLGGSLSLDPIPLAEPAGELPTMSEIMVQANQFQERNQALLLREAEERLVAAAQGAALAVEGVAEAAVTLQLTEGASLEQMRVERATVRLLLGSRHGQVRPVEPVEIGGAAPRETAVGLPTAAETPVAEAVRREVVNQLGLTDGRQVEILIERHESPRR